MTGIEIILLLAGCIFMVGSFFIAEKLSPSELKQIAELSEGELQKIIDKGLKNAVPRVDEAIEKRIEMVSDKVDRALEKETNEKIMAISEYSDTVIQDMNKSHNEIMFLYSMLNDKHSEMTGMASDLQHLASDIRNLQERIRAGGGSAPAAASGRVREEERGREELSPETTEQMPKTESAATVQTEPAGAPTAASVFGKDNHNEEILVLHRDGHSEVEIARKLGLGVGEVRLVIGLYRGEGNT